MATAITYAWMGRNPMGEQVSGEVSAESRADAIAQLPL